MPAKPKILCVDDLDVNLKVRAMFLELFGCEVITTQDHRSTLKALENTGVDLLLIDYHLAGGATGEEIARDVRVLHPEIRLVMLTGDSKMPDSARDSVDAVLVKGASNPEDLLNIIQRLLPHAVLRRRRPAPVVPPPKSA